MFRNLDPSGRSRNYAWYSFFQAHEFHVSKTAFCFSRKQHMVT